MTSKTWKLALKSRDYRHLATDCNFKVKTLVTINEVIISCRRSKNKQSRLPYEIRYRYVKYDDSLPTKSCLIQ